MAGDTPQTIREEILSGEVKFDAMQFDSYFKYFSDHIDVIDGIFTKNVIRFTQPRALNDPLEFSPMVRFRQDQANYTSYELDGLLLPSVEVFTRVQLIESQINAWGILSLTKRPNLFNMWAQYANGHKGFVIEFKPDFNTYRGMKSKSGAVYEIRPVTYVDEYAIRPEDIVDSKGNIPLKTLLDELFFKKTSRWKYEYEYRMVRPLSDYDYYVPPKTNYVYTDTKPYLFSLDVACISSIILGASMTRENKAKILEFSEEHGIPVSQAHVIRDIADYHGQPSRIIILRVNADNRQAVLTSQPQLYCTDTIHLAYRDKIKIRRLSDLPYYQDHEAIVNELYGNLKARSSQP